LDSATDKWPAVGRQFIRNLNAFMQARDYLRDPAEWVKQSTQSTEEPQVKVRYKTLTKEDHGECESLSNDGQTPRILRHTYRAWLDSVGTSVGVQQKLIRHTDVRTTMRYGDAFTSDMAEAHGKVVGLVLNGAQTERRPS